MIDMANRIRSHFDDAKTGFNRTRVDADKDQSVLVFLLFCHVICHLKSAKEQRQKESKINSQVGLEPDGQIGHPEGVSKISAETLAQYERTLAKDPNSKVFAALADAYRELNRWGEAELMARGGIERHPDYVGGYLVLARILILTRRADAAEAFLKTAVQLSPENLLAYQLLGQVYVLLKRPQEALKAHKMVLFLNPLSEKSRQAVEKLETLTAADYDDEIFEMRPLKKAEPDLELAAADPDTASRRRAEAKKNLRTGDLERSLSLVDALIVRNDLVRAKARLKELNEDFPDSIEVQKRWSYFEDESAVEEIESLRPILSREKRIVERKRELLEKLLRRVEMVRAER